MRMDLVCLARDPRALLHLQARHDLQSITFPQATVADWNIASHLAHLLAFGFHWSVRLASGTRRQYWQHAQSKQECDQGHFTDGWADIWQGTPEVLHLVVAGDLALHVLHMVYRPLHDLPRPVSVHQLPVLFNQGHLKPTLWLEQRLEGLQAY